MSAVPRDGATLAAVVALAAGDAAAEGVLDDGVGGTHETAIANVASAARHRRSALTGAGGRRRAYASPRRDHHVDSGVAPDGGCRRGCRG